MIFDIVWTTDDQQWERARELATARIAVGADQALLDDFLVVGTMWFTLGGRFTRPVALADPAIEAALRWTVWRGRSSPSPATTYFGAGFEVVLFEFAWQLALIVDRGVQAGADGKAPCYSMFDEAFSLCFVKARGFVWIVSNNESDHGWAMPVPDAAFIDGARRFLRDFTAELDRRVPGIIVAHIGDPLRPYLTEIADSIR